MTPELSRSFVVTGDCDFDQRYPFVVVYNDAKWNLEKRFSDFAELDAQLDEAFKNNEDVVVCCRASIAGYRDSFALSFCAIEAHVCYVCLHLLPSCVLSF